MGVQNANYSKHLLLINRRGWIVSLILIAVAVALITRLFYLTVVNRDFLQHQGDSRVVRKVIVPAHRGMILDRHNELLAISTPAIAVWIDPALFKATASQYYRLSQLVHVPVNTILLLVKQRKNKEFIYLKRALPPQVGDQVKALNLPGVFLKQEYHRYYPEGAVMAHVVGLTDIDDKGQEGLELAYDDWLSGRAGVDEVAKDCLGHIVAKLCSIRAPRSGKNLQLSIDRRIQYIAYRELNDGIKKYQASSGSIIVLDIKSGELLAMVNWPNYNPNKRQQLNANHSRNRALTDLFEPGSTIKTFSMASVLASGRFTESSQIDTAPGWMIVAGKRIMDERNNGVLDLTKILQISSNMGMSKLVLSLPPNQLRHTLHQVGFGQLTQSGFPGERAGMLPNFNVWNPFVLATLSFGYGLSVTLLQLTQAYAVLARGGINIPITFLKATDNAPAQTGERVLDRRISKRVLNMLESVLAKAGTAPLARVSGYRVTGKTGTARIVGQHGYEKNHHNSLFIGIAPASQPRLVVAVLLRDPKAHLYYGGYTAGPIFSRVMSSALHLLGVEPDDQAGLA